MLSIDNPLPNSNKLPLYVEIKSDNNNSDKPQRYISKLFKKVSYFSKDNFEDDDYPFRFEIETSFAFITILFVLFCYFLWECNPNNAENYDYEGVDFIEPCTNASISINHLIQLKNQTENLHKELGSLNVALYYHIQNDTINPYDDIVIRYDNVRGRYLNQAKQLNEQYNIYLKCYETNVIKYYKYLSFQNGIFCIIYLMIVGIFIYAAIYYIREIDKNELTEYQLLIHKRNNFIAKVSVILNAFCGIGALIIFFFPAIDQIQIKEYPL